MRLILSFIILAFVSSACGGSSSQRPGPLSYHFDEAHIASVDMNAKQNVLTAQNEYHVAKAALNKATADYNESETKLSVAKNEQKQAILEAESTEAKQKAAKLSNDMNRINEASKLVLVSTLERRAADEKVTALKAHRKHLEHERNFREEEMYHREAIFELAKADLAKANNIQPQDFIYAGYASQVSDRAARVEKAKQRVQDYKSTADNAKKAWQDRKQEADKARG